MGRARAARFYSLKCDYRLVIDNLMDLTHETYVHAGSIGDEAITSSPFDVTHTDRTATVTRWMIDIDPPPFWKKQLDRPGHHVDRWQIIYFQAPSVIVGDVGVAVTGTGAPQGDRSQGVNGAFLAAITPETETSCHYFWNFVRTFRTDDEQLTRDITKAHVNDGNGVYDQDHTVLEAQQKAIDRNPAHALLQPQHRCRRALGAAADRRAPGEGARACAGSAQPGRRVARRGRSHRMAGRRAPRDPRPRARYPAVRDRAGGRVRAADARQPYQRHRADRRPRRHALLFGRRPLHGRAAIASR